MLIGCCALAQQPISALQRFELYGQAQGTTYTISYYDEKPRINQSAIDSIFAVIDRSMSLYKEGSLINQFNANDTKRIAMDPHMATVIKKSFAIHKESKGLFDITVKPLVSLWGFGPDKRQDLPDAAAITTAMKTVGMKKLRVRGKSLLKRIPFLQIDLNGIAQGYTVDVLHDYLMAKNITQFIVEVGGEIRAHGEKPDGTPFRVLVDRPESAGNTKSHVVELRNKAITTSGSYEKFRQVKDYTFSHHIDPRTGYPLKSSTIAVTVIAETAMDADAYDNVFMAMNPRDAITFANSKNIIDIYLLYLEEGQVKEGYSKGFKKYLLTD